MAIRITNSLSSGDFNPAEDRANHSFEFGLSERGTSKVGRLSLMGPDPDPYAQSPAAIRLELAQNHPHFKSTIARLEEIGFKATKSGALLEFDGIDNANNVTPEQQIETLGSAFTAIAILKAASAISKEDALELGGALLKEISRNASAVLDKAPNFTDEGLSVLYSTKKGENQLRLDESISPIIRELDEIYSPSGTSFIKVSSLEAQELVTDMLNEKGLNANAVKPHQEVGAGYKHCIMVDGSIGEIAQTLSSSGLIPEAISKSLDKALDAPIADTPTRLREDRSARVGPSP